MKDMMVIICDEDPVFGTRGPVAYGGCPVTMHLYVDDVDDCVERGVAAGATLQKLASNQFSGDRSGAISDPFGYSWAIESHIDDVWDDELETRWHAMCEEMAKGELIRFRT